MKREEHDTDVEPHVFDQTNGVVGLGTEAGSDDLRAGRPDRRTVAGIAMLSTQRP